MSVDYMKSLYHLFKLPNLFCFDKGQMAVAKKLLKSLTTTNKEVRTTSKFYQHETKTTLGFCLNPSKISADSRFNALYRSFMTFDEESFQKLPLAEKASLKGSVLQGLAEIMSNLTNVTNLRELFLVFWLKDDKKQHLRKTFLNSDDDKDSIKWVFKTRHSALFLPFLFLLNPSPSL